ncbi:MAG: DUF4115 domain-containing protein [Deltaproteobacteria bacterium]|nr:DUF4115 domain-containing protein [Deltaproteobacteria bacterium]
MESPGEYLRRERELRGVSLSKIFEATRVPMRYLEALEADNYEILPHPTFVKGYIKSYCKALGLDEVDAALRYEIYLREKAEKAERPKPAAKKKSSRQAEVPKNIRNAAAFISAGVIIIVVLYFAGVGRKATAPEPQPEALSGPMEAVPATPDIEAMKAEAPKQESPGAEVDAKTDANAVKAEPRPAPAVEAQHTLSVKANEFSWIKIRIDEGEPFDVVLREGEGIVWKAKDVFSLIVGNAGGVTLTYDGKVLPPLGKSGEVVSFKLQKSAQVKTLEEPKPAPPSFGQPWPQDENKTEGARE